MLARVSQSYIRKLIARGEIGAVRVGNGETGPLRIPTESFEKWLFGGPTNSPEARSRSSLSRRFSPSPAAIHEAAHSVALEYGWDVHPFVRSVRAASATSAYLRRDDGIRTSAAGAPMTLLVCEASGRVDGRRDGRGDFQRTTSP